MKSDCIVFVYDHFYPDFSAGGPVTSLNNLSQLLNSSIQIRVVTSAYEYESKAKLQHIIADQWTKWNDIIVWYASGRESMRKAISEISPGSTLYLNGVFSLSFFLYPLRLAQKQKLDIIISPRGMLQDGALRSKALKKRLYLTLLKWSGRLRNARWHATDDQEKTDILNFIGGDASVDVIPNIPAYVNGDAPIIQKKEGELSLIYLSIIAEKKNLLFVLQLFEQSALENIRLDIAGPVKDEAYWEQCLILIKKYSGRVNYIGKINPEKVSETISSYHALVLPTKGENFGHAIVESLAASRPVIISDKTPWTDLESKGAGFSLPLQKDIWTAKLRQMLQSDNIEFQHACSSALAYYRHKFDFEKLKTDYIKFFTSNKPQ